MLLSCVLYLVVEAGIGWLYCTMEGLYPSTPSTEGNTPLFAFLASLSRAISARNRRRSFSAS
jgi:hypothetical protein